MAIGGIAIRLRFRLGPPYDHDYDDDGDDDDDDENLSPVWPIQWRGELCRCLPSSFLKITKIVTPMKKRKDIRSMMMLMILIAIPTCGKLSYSRILSMATLSLSRLHIIRTVQLKTVKRYENTKNIDDHPHTDNHPHRPNENNEQGG